MGIKAPRDEAKKYSIRDYADMPLDVMDESWENRRLCVDENCIGVIGPDGRCKECGKPGGEPVPAPTPPLIEFGPCCFCNQSIVDSDVDPCTVTVETAQPEHWQVWKCHARCFKERLAKRDDFMFHPAHF